MRGSAGDELLDHELDEGLRRRWLQLDLLGESHGVAFPDDAFHDLARPLGLQNISI